MGEAALNGQCFRHLKAGSAQGRHLGRIVGHQLDFADAQKLQHAGGKGKMAPVMLKAQNFVRIECIQPLRLQAIGAHFIADAGAAPLLIQIKDNATRPFRHGFGGGAQLVAAIAFQTAEQIAGQAGRMQAHRHRLAEIGCANDNGHLIAQALAAAKHHKFGVLRPFQGHRCAGDKLERRHTLRAILCNGRGRCAEQVRIVMFRDNNGGQNQRQFGQFQRRQFQRACRGQCGHSDARPAADQGQNLCLALAGHIQRRALHDLQPQPAQTGRAQNQPFGSAAQRFDAGDTDEVWPFI